MFLSMWIIEAALRDFHTEPHITSGTMCIRSSSLLMNGKRSNPHTVYICPSESVIDTMKEKTICVNKNDYIIVDTGEIEEVFNVVDSLADRFLDWDMEITDRIEAGCGLQEIMEQASELLQCYVSLLDSGFIIQADAGQEYVNHSEEIKAHLRIGDGLPDEYADQFLQINPSMSAGGKAYYYYENLLRNYVIIRNISTDARINEILVINHRDEKPETWLLQISEVIADQILRWNRKNPPAEEKPAHIRLLERVLDRDPELEEGKVLTYLQRMHWNRDDLKYVFVLSNIDPHGYYAKRLERFLAEHYPAGFSLLWGDSYMLLINTRLLPVSVLEQELERLLNNTPVCAGISYPFHNIMKLSAHRTQAQTAVRMGEQFGQQISRCDEFILPYVRQVLKENLDSDLSHPMVRKLDVYDRSHHSNLLATLKIYLQKERSLVGTADALGIQVSTLKYRLKRIRELFPCNLDNDTVRMHLFLSIWLKDTEG